MQPRYSKIILPALSAILGMLFLYSAYSKLFPVSFFEAGLIQFYGIPWKAAPIIARSVVIIEFILGVTLLLNLYLIRKAVLLLATSLLIFFTFLLFLLWVNKGNEVDCGCFGEEIVMSPLVSIVKNILMMAVIGVLYRWHPGWQTKWAFWLILSITGITIAYTLLSQPFIVSVPKQKNLHQKLDLSSVQAKIDEKSYSDSIAQGKHILAFLSLKCHYCVLAARKLSVVKYQYPDTPIFMVLNGKENLLPDFHKKTDTKDIPYIFLKKDYFAPLAGVNLPIIYYLNNGVVEKTISYNEVESDDIRNWLKD